MRRLLLLASLLAILMGIGGVFAQTEATPEPEATAAPDLLAVTDVLPGNGAIEVAIDSTITVVFNRPVVPLTVGGEADTLPQPLQFDPPVAGTGDWLNTAIYVFTPDPAFAGGTPYTVTIDKDLRGLDGVAQGDEYSWTFSTDPPVIEQMSPGSTGSSNGGVDPETTLQVRFNQPVDQANTEAAFFLRRVDGENGVTLSGQFEWADDGKGFRFTPDDLFTLETDYVWGFSTRPLTTAGVKVTGNLTRIFRTDSLPAIIETYPADGDQEAEPWGGIRIEFATEMNVATLAEHIRVTPEPEWVDAYYSEWRDRYNYVFPTRPNTDYVVEILPGMEDVFGNPITEGRTIRYHTRDYEPNVVLQTPGGLGFYNGGLDQTRLFIAHRNVSKLQLELYQVSTDHAVEVLYGRDSYSYGGSIDAENPANATLLRAWDIPTTTAVRNMTRYELVDLNPQRDATCLNAPQSRLQVGDLAVVLTDPEPLRARSEPVTGDVIEQMTRETRVEILDGSRCVGGLLWWRVRLPDQREAWVAEGAADEYFLGVDQAASTTPVDVLSDNGEPLPPGVYYLRVTAPEMPRYENNSEWDGHVMLVGTANLIVKRTATEVMVWATDVMTGEPIAGAPLIVYSRKDDALVEDQIITDADGVARINQPAGNDSYRYQSVVVTLEGEGSFGVASNVWTEGINSYQFGVSSSAYQPPYRMYLYSDRPIYRPGQPVYFRGVLRQQDDVSFTPPDITEIPVQVYNDAGDLVYEKTLPLTEFGTFSDQFTLDDEAMLGFYRIQANYPGTESDYRPQGTLYFITAEYRLPEFEVNVTSETPSVLPGDTAQVTVDARYYFGGAVGGGTVEYTVVARNSGFSYRGQGYYSFRDANSDDGPYAYYSSDQQEIADGVATLDEQGRFTIELPVELTDARGPQIFTIEATVTDESEQAVSGRTSFTVHPGDFYVGVRTRRYVARANEPSQVEVIAVDTTSQPLPNTEIAIEIVERNWSNVQELDAEGRSTWTSEIEEIPVASGTVTTDENGLAVYEFTPPRAGSYRVVASARDSGGRRIAAATTLYASGREYVSWRQQNSNRIDLVVDQPSYNVGDTAQILIASPFQGEAEALITVERRDVITVERVTLTSNSYVYELPITPAFAPNVFVSVLIVKGVDETNPVASFRMGISTIVVDTSQKVITLAVTTDPPQGAPGETVTYTVTATDYAGDPVQAEIGVGVTDAASLAIAAPNSGLMLPHFYFQRSLGVTTGTALVYNTDQITQTVLDSVKGGGGGFGDGGIFDIREEFVDTAYWNGAVVTDANGVATFQVTLPDNLTTWVLDARAVTDGRDGLTLVGQTTSDLLSTLPLLIRPITPRFFIVDDVATVAAIVNNNTEAPQTVQVTLQVEGAAAQEETPLSQIVTINAGARARVDWRLRIDDVPGVQMTFFAVSEDGQYTDASTPPLGMGEDDLIVVHRYEVPETIATSGTLREAGDRVEQISLPDYASEEDGELILSLEPSLAGATTQGLDYLKNFPHQCLEQTVSRFLPNIITYRALAELNLAQPSLQADLEAGVSFAVQRLYALQKPDGGWGWFPRDQSNPNTTAWAVIGLYEAQQQGFPVSDTVFERAVTFLRSQYIAPNNSRARWSLNRQAFILYTMARIGQPDSSRAARLFASRERLSTYAKAYLAMAIDAEKPDAPEVETLLSDILNSATVRATGISFNEDYADYWNWNTNTRTTAIVLHALVNLRPESELIPNIVNWLMTARTTEAWETTQETAWAVMALTDWMLLSGELTAEYNFTAALNDQTVVTREVTTENVLEVTELRIDVADMLAGQINTLTLARDGEGGALYYTAHLRVMLDVPSVEPLSNGITVERTYALADDEEHTPITSATVGELVEARLTIIVPSALHYVVVEDPIPAGSDAVNPNLLTSQQVGTRPEFDQVDSARRGWGWWWFSETEFRDDRVVMYAEYLPAGTYSYVYTIRPGLPGEYNVIPPTAYEFYYPEVYGRGAGSLFTITPGE